MYYRSDICVPFLKVFLTGFCFPRRFAWMQCRSGGNIMMSTVSMDIPWPYQQRSKEQSALSKTARDFTSEGTQFLETILSYLTQCS